MERSSMAINTEPRSDPAANPRGFTLIEMLTAVAIIAILVMLLLPVIQSPRYAVRSTQRQGQPPLVRPRLGQPCLDSWRPPARSGHPARPLALRPRLGLPSGAGSG